jgi:DNA-binding transcriptional ArsR family regulator
LQTILWKTGTAYDFFVSLAVLHEPAIFGLRPSWAAGVRQRVPAAKREFLEKVLSFSSVPLKWLSELPEPGDARTALKAIESLSSIERLEVLTLAADTTVEVKECLQNIARRGSWTEAEIQVLREQYRRRDSSLSPENLNLLVSTWSEPQRSATLFLEAIQDYYQVFFAEEEPRIRPALQSGLEHAQELSTRMNLESLIEELSHGIRFTPLDSTVEFILVPSYWCSPLIFYTRLPEGKILLLFGARPEFETIVPGAGPSPQLVNTLKALADPTRLRILKILADQPLSSTELARLLRLRLPTVTHHLRSLRLSGLVQITVGETEKRYATRLEILDGLHQTLGNFIRTKE